MGQVGGKKSRGSDPESKLGLIDPLKTDLNLSCAQPSWWIGRNCQTWFMRASLNLWISKNKLTQVRFEPATSASAQRSSLAFPLGSNSRLRRLKPRQNRLRWLDCLRGTALLFADMFLAARDWKPTSGPSICGGRCACQRLQIYTV